MALDNGKYVAKNEKTVTYWKAPDADGDGPEYWEDRVDSSGRITGRDLAKDRDGKPLRKYNPPEGFENRPSFDNTDNFVRVDGRGQIVRDAHGNAVTIRPGHALVEHADGRSELLPDEYAHYQFLQSHDKVSDDTTSPLVDQTHDGQDQGGN